MASVDSFIGIILSVELWPWGRLSRCVGLTTYHLHVPRPVMGLLLPMDPKPN
jgi:hypothetical protein